MTWHELPPASGVAFEGARSGAHSYLVATFEDAPAEFLAVRTVLGEPGAETIGLFGSRFRARKACETADLRLRN